MRPAWTLITYMIVKVLLFEDRGVYDSIHRAKELFQGHLAAQVAGDFGFGLLGFLFRLTAFLLAFSSGPTHDRAPRPSSLRSVTS